ncbi:hypothetical protein GWI33_005347 [Rhynchophorus ferrugineus]|uniref:Uncharacterized protein n=1 Tax=Rhynchophorus ferrugineus TaxID=354439 RepID=A0A834IU42_RHYFE|nr:hypothetical protein GWI33_005347 [Rhynchophorus ferrugineus]
MLTVADFPVNESQTQTRHYTFRESIRIKWTKTLSVFSGSDDINGDCPYNRARFLGEFVAGIKCALAHDANTVSWLFTDVFHYFSPLEALRRITFHGISDGNVALIRYIVEFLRITVLFIKYLINFGRFICALFVFYTMLQP